MEYSVGQTLRYIPSYFKWQSSHDVEVRRIYPNGHILLSDESIADEDGFVIWRNRVVGKLEAINA